MSENKFYWTNGFWTAIGLFLIYLLILLAPSYLTFTWKQLPDAEKLFDINGIEKGKFTFAFYRINEILSFSIVCITAIILIFGNTLYYGWSFKDELMDNRHNVGKGWFNSIAILYVFWLLGTLGFSLIFKSDYDTFNQSLSLANTYKEKNELGKIISVDRQFTSDITTIFSDFIHHVELFTIGTIALFIVIDWLSYIIKKKQIMNTQAVAKPTIEINLLEPQKSFVFHQLMMIDIPVIIGILLISFFIYLIPKEDSYANYSQSAFIAGALGMHLIISQFIFLFLNFKYKYNEFKTKNSK